MNVLNDVSLRNSKPGAATGAALYMDVFDMEPMERIRRIERGLHPASVVRLANAMGRSKASVANMLALAVSTVDRKAQKGERLSPEQSERVMGLVKLIGQVQAMVQQSGDAAGFNAAQWFSEWLDTPLPAIGGKRPATLMNTAEGQQLISRLLEAMRIGAYV